MEAFARRNLSGTQWDRADFEGLNPEGNTPDALKVQALADIWVKAIPAMVNANSEAEVVSIWEDTISSMESSGLADIESIVNERWQERVQLWGIEN
jgi:putative aldouronate transport system substrate-binding protein